MKSDVINKLIQHAPVEKLGKINKMFGTNYTKEELYLQGNSEKTQEDFCLHVTDLHYGKKTYNYSISICNVKIHRLINKLDTIYNIEKKSRQFQSFTILDTGDMVDGIGIFPTQSSHTDEPRVFEQVKGVVNDFYSPLIEWGLKHFPKVRICKVPGNHGRVTYQHAESDNWDCMATEFLHMKYSLSQKVAINGGAEFFRVFDVNGHNIALFHGAYTTQRNYMGLPYYKLGETASMWNQTNPFDMLFIGHYHQMAMIPLKIGLEHQRCYLGGTMATGDDYSIINFGRDGMHQWWLFGLHKDRKNPTFQYQLDLL